MLLRTTQQYIQTSNGFILQFLSDITVFNSDILLITQSRLSVSQASSSFKCPDTHMPMYVTPTYTTEALRLVTYVQQIIKVK